MNDAIIKNNLAYCPKCKTHGYKIFTNNYSLVRTKSKGKAVKFICECLKCGTRFKYLKTLKIDREEVFIDDNVKEIKEES